MKKRHLRLVVSHCETTNKSTLKSGILERLKDFLDGMFLSKNEKIYIIKDILIKIYRDYEITTGFVDIPYFVRAESRISQIIKDKKVDYYYNRLKRFQSNNFKQG